MTAREPQPADWQEYLRSLAAFGMRPGLERVAALLERLDHPERSFRAIHVVGTNGKSSTTRYAAAVLTASGLRSGAYLSPHISGFEERVLVDGAPVAPWAIVTVAAALAGLVVACIAAAVWGELATRSCFQKKVAGVVIDGAIRDTAEIRELKFPAFSRHAAANHKRACVSSTSSVITRQSR